MGLLCQVGRGIICGSMPAPLSQRVMSNLGWALHSVRTHARAAALLLVACGVLPLEARAETSGQDGNLLAGLTPIARQGVTSPARLTDGRAADEGAFWLTDLTTRFRSKDAFATFDLGTPSPIRCAYLQGDNNDVYEVSGSMNGDDYFPLFVAPAVNAVGLRDRTLKLSATAQFVRIRAYGGDGSYSLSELALYKTCPEPWPPEVHRVEGTALADTVKTRVHWVAVAGVLFVLFFLAGRPRGQMILAGAGLGVLVAVVAQDLFTLYPFFGQEPLIRATVAVVAGSLAIREFLLPNLPTLDKRASGALLGILAALSVGCYYHFGAAQFWHAKEGRNTYVHSYDMRHYFPVGKYFSELSFDGLYAASFAAFLDLRDAPFEQYGDQRFRDLRESKVKSATEMRSHVEDVRRRFSDERWAAFKADILTFVEIMGDRAFLDNMNDHGGNATPVWLLSASPVLRLVPATEITLVLLGLFDPVLLAVMFFFVGRVFGWRVMGYVLVLFGATDFYQFGSNLMGSMLRQDWLVALGLGACAFKRDRFALSGALFAYAGLIRAFPAMATFFVVLPALWWLAGERLRRKAMPAWAEIRAAERPTIRAAAGALACVVLLFSLSAVVFGPRAWIAWGEKISIHASDVSVNNIGLRNVMAYDPDATARKLTESGTPNPWGVWENNFFENLRRRAPAHGLAMAAFVVLVVLACRRRSPESAALIGLTTIPFCFYPSNYYLHLIFLLPLAISAKQSPRRFGEWVAILCALCVGQYATYDWAHGWTDEFFNYQSFLLIAAFVAMVWPLAREGWSKTLASGTPSSETDVSAGAKT